MDSMDCGIDLTFVVVLVVDLIAVWVMCKVIDWWHGGDV